MLKGALDLEAEAWGPNPRPAIRHPAGLLGLLGLLSLPVPHKPGLPQTAGRDIRCKQEFLPRMRSDSFIHLKVPTIPKKGTAGQRGKRCCDPEKQPRGIVQQPGPRMGSLAPRRGQLPRLRARAVQAAEGTKRHPPPWQCQIPHSQRPEGPKDFQGNRAAGLRGRTPREPRAALPDAVARWRSELTLPALRPLWRGLGRGRRT